jgi:hypothetical protein
MNLRAPMFSSNKELALCGCDAILWAIGYAPARQVPSPERSIRTP